MQVLLQYQSKSYYIIGQEVYYSIGRLYYIIGRFLLHYRAVITVSGVYYIIGWYNTRFAAVRGIAVTVRPPAPFVAVGFPVAQSLMSTTALPMSISWVFTAEHYTVGYDNVF